MADEIDPRYISDGRYEIRGSQSINKTNTGKIPLNGIYFGGVGLIPLAAPCVW